MPDWDFGKLAERLQANDPTAPQALLDRYGDALRREARLTLLSRELRRLVSESDVCQSVFARFFIGYWAGQYELHDDQQLLALLKTMVRSRVVDLHRRHTAEKRDVRRTKVIGDAVNACADQQQSSPSRDLILQELQERFSAALPESCRKILELRQEHRGWPEIAELVGEPGRGEALRKQYERAVAKAADVLELGE